MSPPPERHLVDELLEEIFLRLPTPAALAGASSASPRFRRIITDRSFLRRYRKLHPPPLLGFVDEHGFHPAQAPHPSAPLARALADAADFTYSFVPGPSEVRWSPCDARDGRVLLKASPPSQFLSFLAVCDPLSRRYVLIPPIPEYLADQGEEFDEIQSMLAPIGDDVEVGDDVENETSFRVICAAHYETKLVAFVFSPITGNWRLEAWNTWTSLGTDQPAHLLADRSHLHGCFYWTGLWVDKLLVLDARSMEFSTIDYFLTGDHKQIMNQAGQSRSVSYIVAGGGGEALEMFSLVHDQSTEMFSLVHDQSTVHHSIQQINDQSMEWRLEKIIPLPAHAYCFASGAAEGFLFLGLTKYEPNIGNKAWSMIDLEDHYLLLDVQTAETTKVCRNKETPYKSGSVYSYFGFPPSLSKPSI